MTKGDATNPFEFRFLLQYDEGGTLEAIEPKYGDDAETRSARTHIEPLPSGSTVDFIIRMPLGNDVPFVQLQGRCPSATTANILADAQYMLGY